MDLTGIPRRLWIMDGGVELIVTPLGLGEDEAMNSSPDLQPVRLLHIAKDLPRGVDEVDVEECPEQVVQDGRVLIEVVVEVHHVVPRDLLSAEILRPLKEVAHHRHAS